MTEDVARIAEALEVIARTAKWVGVSIMCYLYLRTVCWALKGGSWQ